MHLQVHYCETITKPNLKPKLLGVTPPCGISNLGMIQLRHLTKHRHRPPRNIVLFANNEHTAHNT